MKQSMWGNDLKTPFLMSMDHVVPPPGMPIDAIIAKPAITEVFHKNKLENDIFHVYNIPKQALKKSSINFFNSMLY